MILTEKLTVNGVQLPISGYSRNTPTGGMGESVTLALAKPDINSIPVDAVIKFEIGAGLETAPGVITYSWVTVIDTGKLSGRSYSIKWVEDDKGGFPGDLIEISTLSPLADKWGLAPLIPVIMYDPAKVEADRLIVPQEQQVRLGSGYIAPYLEAVEGLSLYNVLDRCYTNKSPLPGVGGGCGFERVITNIPNYELDRVDITQEGGFNGAAASLVTLYKPLVFEDANTLYIIDPERGLPPGFVPRQLPLDCVIEVKQALTPEALANAINVTYKNNPGGGISYNGEAPPVTRLITDEPLISGEGKAYTRREVTRSVIEFYDIVSGELRRTQENYTETKTYAYRDNIAITLEGGDYVRTRTTGSVKHISTERITNTYIGNTKAGHTRTISGLYYNPEAHGADTWGDNLIVEACVLQWEADISHAGASNLVRSETQTTGLCLKETKEDGLTIFTPILDATNSGIIESDNSQALEPNIPLVKTIEELKATGINQANVVTTIFNQLTGGLESSTVQGRTGSRSTYLPPFATRGNAIPGTIREQLRDEDNIALYGLRKILNLDAKDLPRDEALRLGRRALKNTVSPPLNYSITLPGIDFSIRRGSILSPPYRGGYFPNVIVTGYNTTARAIGTDAALREQVLDVKELRDDNE